MDDGSGICGALAIHEIIKMALKVTIITPVFNGASTIENTIESIIQQDYENIEYIIVDGKSTDGTVSLIEKYADQIDKFVSEPDRGIYDAVNKGIKVASGDILCTLNCDDMYADSTIISQMVEFIQSNVLDAAYGDIVYVDRHDTNCVKRFWETGEYKKGSFRYGWVPPHPAFFCRKEIFDKYGDFNDQFEIAGDFELMLRFIEKHQIKIGYLPKIIVKMRIGGKANILRGIFHGNLEIINSFRLNNLRLSLWFFVYKPIAKISQLFKIPRKVK